MVIRINFGMTVKKLMTLNNSVVGSAQAQLRPKWIRFDRSELPRNSYQRNGILFIRNVRREDTGRYTCQTLDRNGRTVFESFVQLTISGTLTFPVNV